MPPLWDGMIQLSQNLSSIVSGAVSAVKLTSASRGGRAAGVGLERLLQLNARCTGAPEYFQLHKHLSARTVACGRDANPKHCDAFGVLRKNSELLDFLDC